MLKIYEIVNNELLNSNEIKKGSWIDLINPTTDELKKVIETTKIDQEILTKLLDEE